MKNFKGFQKNCECTTPSTCEGFISRPYKRGMLPSLYCCASIPLKTFQKGATTIFLEENAIKIFADICDTLHIELHDVCIGDLEEFVVCTF